VASVTVLSAAGEEVGRRELPPELFEAKVSVPLMHQVVVAGLASLRRGTHSTKTRGDVRGGGRKPWRQKGTGRARQGSIRSPQWSGGGVAHGPQPRSHDLRVNKKMKRGALRSALTDALTSGKLAVVDELAGFEGPRTRRAVEILHALELRGRILLVLPGPSEDGAVERSFRNLPEVRMAYARSLGVYELLAADRVLFTQAALDALEGRPEQRPSTETTEAPGGAGGSGPPTDEETE
jgi:large subunit ribosomal protein L4